MAKCLLFTLLILVMVQKREAFPQSAVSYPLPPGANFDLSAWKLQTLDANLKFIEKTGTELEAGYTSSFFYTDSTDGSMVFRVPSNGSTTSGSSYPRSELRQMSDDANWPLADQTEHYLVAECKVINVAQAKPQVIIGQVHGSEDESELLKLRWTGYLPGKCYIEARLELNDATKAEYGVTLASGLSLGDLVSYTITMKAGKLTAWVNGVSATQTYTSAYFGSTDAYYFKAGAYLQYNGTSPVVFGQTKFYKLSLSKQSQIITFNKLPSKKVGDPDFNPAAVASSGLAVSYASTNPGVAVIDGNNIHITGAGNTLITASQVGNLFFNTANNVTQTLTVNQNPTGIDESAENLTRFHLYPNPASGQITICYELTEKSRTGISICDITGRVVRTIEPDQNQKPGKQNLSLSLQGLREGVYFVRYQNGIQTITEKLIICR